ncbi:uncharacterized protein LOC106643489 [Copidosoma floridanum]|uniref:uncharacterized protein LOC106643489 n=1 Tax=Copidosoma floridanum TaxID=29053 RepID=UPI0006C96EB9|nr:uncharacterized protein LOC106643489 [Copidosoma floridanum]
MDESVRKYFTIITFVLLVMQLKPSSSSLTQPKAPNFQYFERPYYRYPYYDNSGKGLLLYGHGGIQLYKYKTYSTLDGIH